MRGIDMLRVLRKAGLEVTIVTRTPSAGEQPVERPAYKLIPGGNREAAERMYNKVFMSRPFYNRQVGEVRLMRALKKAREAAAKPKRPTKAVRDFDFSKLCLKDVSVGTTTGSIRGAHASRTACRPNPW